MIKIKYLGMDGEGHTLKAARAEAAAKVDRLVRDVGYGPAIIPCGAYRALVYRDLAGWRVYIIPDLPKPPVTGDLVVGQREDATVAAAKSISQLDWGDRWNLKIIGGRDATWTHPAVDDETFFRERILHHGPRQLVEAAIAENVAWAKRQRRYRSYLNRGLCDSDAHSMAGGIVPKHLMTDADADRWTAMLKEVNENV